MPIVSERFIRPFAVQASYRRRRLIRLRRPEIVISRTVIGIEVKRPELGT